MATVAGMMGNLGTKARRTGLMVGCAFYAGRNSRTTYVPFGLGGEEGARAGIRYIERLLNDDEAGIMVTTCSYCRQAISKGEGGVIPALEHSGYKSFVVLL